LEKIKKMPMDTVHDKMPVKPVSPDGKEEKPLPPIYHRRK
jgi:hypothetical protein